MAHQIAQMRVGLLHNEPTTWRWVDVMAWEKLFWFLKFLVPKLNIQAPNQDALDELLEAVDVRRTGWRGPSWTM
ncbi:hypothetical protein LCM17_02045 [Cereibacter sphaeroides]|nr:hypothetical protein [Cereibacter sphaeroides]